MSSANFFEGNRLEKAYILQNKVSHVRLLPPASKHAFAYPTLSFLLSLNALEKNGLDLLGGWLFGYGGKSWRVAGLRPSGYLYDTPRDKRSIKQKLTDVLDQRGWPGLELEDAWLMTMPNFLGIEGINPLTVYFCYKRGSPFLWLVILEIHNTFGERSIHILKTGKTEDTQTAQGFDHQWTFPRQFHVSPFNDRSGHYICQITEPSHPPPPLVEESASGLPPPQPIVKITLLTAPPHVRTKLVAILRPTYSTPLSSLSFLGALSRAPFALLLAFPRIAYQAFLLHYHKRLDVYQRPEPGAPDPVIEAHLPSVGNVVQSAVSPIGGVIGWQKEGLLETWCRRRVYAFLRTRCEKTGVSVTFIPANPFDEPATISRPGSSELLDGPTLTIYYRSPRLFTILFMMPSPTHALLLGSHADKIFSVSSGELFSRIFAASWSTTQHPSLTARLSQRIRGRLIPRSIDLLIPPCHSLDEPMSLMAVFVLTILVLLGTLEERIFGALGARFVPGDEPWAGWTRLQSSDLQPPGGDLGSVRREK